MGNTRHKMSKLLHLALRLKSLKIKEQKEAHHTKTTVGVLFKNKNGSKKTHLRKIERADDHHSCFAVGQAA
jgi:hypothetical protein